MLKITSARKQLIAFILYSRKALVLLKILHRLGAINSYIIVEKQKKLYFKVSNAYYKKISLIRNTKILSTPSRSFYISYKALRLLNKRIGAAIYLLSTNKGIISHKTAINKKIGGLLIGYFFY